MHIEFVSEGEYELSDFEFRILPDARYVVFDVEATGPDPLTDSVTQIGAVALAGNNRGQTDSFTQLVKPWKSIPEKIETLTGVTNERVHHSPKFANAWLDFGRFCGDDVLVTQCGYEFDYPILEEECRRAHLPCQAAKRLDTKAIFALLHPEMHEIFSTNFLTNYYAIDRSQFRRHDALGDSYLIAQILVAELKEADRMGIASLAAGKIRIKRFVLPPI